MIAIHASIAGTTSRELVGVLLRRRYSAVLNEPIPADMKALLDKLGDEE